MGAMGALDEPLKDLVGDRTAKVLADSLHLRTVGDLLHHYPRRYVERGQLTSLDELEVDEHVTVLARIEKVTLIPFRGRKGDRLEVVVTDGRSKLSLVFFNQGWRQKDLRPGQQGLFAYKVGLFNRTRQLASPDYQLIDDEEGSSAAKQFATASSRSTRRAPRCPAGSSRSASRWPSPSTSPTSANRCPPNCAPSTA